MSGHANMALARECCLFLVLFILVSLARCENKAPKVSLRGRVDYPRRGAPSADSPVPPDHVFYHNHQLDFSWTDPALQMALWRGLKTEQQLQAEFGAKARRKRQSPGSPGPTNTNPRAVFQLPSCAGCVAAANGAPPPTLQSLSVQYLGNQIKYTPPELYNGCVFYTAVVGPTDFVVRRRLGGTDVHPGLSKIASDWACSNGRKSIWVSQILGTVWRRPRREESPVVETQLTIWYGTAATLQVSILSLVAGWAVGRGHFWGEAHRFGTDGRCPWTAEPTTSQAQPTTPASTISGRYILPEVGWHLCSTSASNISHRCRKPWPTPAEAPSLSCLSTQPTLRVTDTSGGIVNSQPCVSNSLLLSLRPPLLPGLGQGHSILTTLPRSSAAQRHVPHLSRETCRRPSSSPSTRPTQAGCS